MPAPTEHSETRPSLHVIGSKECIASERLPGRVAVVFDVLLATTTIATALSAGARGVWPVADVDAAKARAARLTDSPHLLAGEQHLEPIPGFASYRPLVLASEPLAGHELILLTTNGTVALDRCASALATYAACLRNAAAVADRLCQHHTTDTVLLVCAGSAGRFSLEDCLGAGAVAARLLARQPDAWNLTDAARAALAVHRAHAKDTAGCLADTRLGQLLVSLGMADDIRHAAATDVCTTVPLLQAGGARLVLA
jgi:2-phosphosulfolactate phosphatase